MGTGTLAGQARTRRGEIVALRLLVAGGLAVRLHHAPTGDLPGSEAFRPAP